MNVDFPPKQNAPKVPNLGPWIVPVAILVIVFLMIGSLFYTVDSDEVGVVLRFGKYVRTTQPGLRFKLPFGVETVKKVRVRHVFKEEFGFRTLRAGVRTVYAKSSGRGRSSYGLDSFLGESLMLTGDLNCAVVEWIVQYKIKNAFNYLFKVRDPEDTIRDMSEVAMRLVVGDRTISEVLTLGREEIRMKAKEKLQALLDKYETGINVLNVVLQDVNPPDEVKPSFNEVNEARQEKEKLVNQAWEEYNRAVPRAKGEAEQVILKAEGYALDRVNRAEGDAKKFVLTWEAYKTAKDVTRRRLYLETMKKVLPELKQKYFIDSGQKGILPFLDLKKEGGQTS